MYQKLGSLKKQESGNKAWNLDKLASHNLKVPEAVVLPIRFFADSNYKSRVRDLAAQLETIVPAKDGWAIRSSSIEEDTHETAAAGKYETVFIRKAEELPDAVATVFKSADPDKMAVIIQRFIDADFSGVVFSKDPVTHESAPVIEIVKGTGEQMVGGMVTPFSYKKGRWTGERPIDLQLENEITETVQKIKGTLGYEIDMEFCIKNKAIYWLQVRPITSNGPAQQMPDVEWYLLDQCTEPVPMLLEKLDPSGLFHSKHWDIRFINHFPFFKLKKSLAQATAGERDILQEWYELRDHYEPIFDSFLREDLSGLSLAGLQLRLKGRIQAFRDYCEAYMERGWLRARINVKKEVEEAIATALGNEANIERELSLLSTGIDTITAKKHRLLEDLVSDAREIDDFMELADEIDLHGDHPWVKEFHDFIDEFGYESPHPVTCHLPTLKENPQSLLELIKGSEGLAENEESDGWEQHATLIESRLPNEMKQKFREKLKMFRGAVLRTENDDELMQKGSAATRMVLMEMGRRLEDQKLLKSADQVFYLLPEELENGEIDEDDVRHRMDEISRAQESGPGFGNHTENSRTDLLKGTAASFGTAEGIVYQLPNPLDRSSYRQIPQGAILVAPILTPTLAYNLLSVAGIVTEVGGFLSHGAIFAREKGIPAIVAVDSAMDLLKTGERVRLDTTTATIEIIR